MVVPSQQWQGEGRLEIWELLYVFTVHNKRVRRYSRCTYFHFSIFRPEPQTRYRQPLDTLSREECLFSVCVPVMPPILSGLHLSETIWNICCYHALFASSHLAAGCVTRPNKVSYEKQEMSDVRRQDSKVRTTKNIYLNTAMPKDTHIGQDWKAEFKDT